MQAQTFEQGVRHIEAELERLRTHQRHELAAELGPDARRAQQRLAAAMQELLDAAGHWDLVGQRHEALLPVDDRRAMRLPPLGLDQIQWDVRSRLGEPIPLPIPQMPGQRASDAQPQPDQPRAVEVLS